ncbi:hypothetical protein [Desulfovibrio inopinatus]|uniref:hypothetical protein n=1 Tax=Desulfovibrio inopinatus TaxID=102109 RepID=UPI0003F825EA|nr:hypothetical protein [Desulfovibrio inopinatus]
MLQFLAQASKSILPDVSLPNTWPFGPGYSEGFWSVVLKYGFIAIIFAFIALMLRFLFGPGGPLRDKEFDLPPEELKKLDQEFEEKRK